MSTNWLEQIYQAHGDLLARVEQSSDETTLAANARALIDQARRAGTHIAGAQDREYIQSVLAFWGNWVYRQTKVYPNTELYPPPPVTATASASSSTAPQSQPMTALPAAVSLPTRATGQPFIMANIVSPTDGATAVVNESLSLTGLYANLRPNWRMYFITQDQIGRITLLDSGYAPSIRPEAGTWQPEQSFTPTTTGIYHLGLLLAITPDAIDACRSAYHESRALDSTPNGAITFADLIALRVDEAEP
jgi:hypothetical protein